MAKYLNPSVLNAALAVIQTGTKLYFCNGQPVSDADAQTKAAGPAITLAAGDYTLSTPAAGQRAVTIAAKSETATASQNVDHIAITDGTNVLFVDTVATAQTSNSGATISDGAVTLTLGAIA